MDDFYITDVTPRNIAETGVFCIKDKKDVGARHKADWFNQRYEEGLRLKILTGKNKAQAGMIEYVPAEYAWRPVNAANYLFIHCIVIFNKDARNRNLGSVLIDLCLQDAKSGGKYGICAITSEGAWMANKSVFERNGFVIAGRLGRFELMVKKFDESAPTPNLIDWNKELPKYSGWHLVYSDQCPWHEKSAQALQEAARQRGILLHVTRARTAVEAKTAPSGFGSFSLIKDGKLLEDHYLSKTRFENILNKELKEESSKTKKGNCRFHQSNFLS